MLGDRLKGVRKALGLSQTELAEMCGVTIRSQRNYEKGERQPDAEYLASIREKHGIDINYLVTGEETSPIPAGLPADEQLLLDSYRALPVAQRRTMLASLLSGDTGTEKKTSAKSKKGNVLQATGNGNVQIGGNNDK